MATTVVSAQALLLRPLGHCRARRRQHGPVLSRVRVFPGHAEIPGSRARAGRAARGRGGGLRAAGRESLVQGAEVQRRALGGSRGGPRDRAGGRARCRGAGRLRRGHRHRDPDAGPLGCLRSRRLRAAGAAHGRRRGFGPGHGLRRLCRSQRGLRRQRGRDAGPLASLLEGRARGDRRRGLLHEGGDRCGGSRRCGLRRGCPGGRGRGLRRGLRRRLRRRLRRGEPPRPAAGLAQAPGQAREPLPAQHGPGVAGEEEAALSHGGGRRQLLQLHEHRPAVLG